MPQKLRLAQIVLIIQAFLSAVVLGLALFYIGGRGFFTNFSDNLRELFLSNAVLAILSLLVLAFLIFAPIWQIICALYLPRQKLWAYRWASVLAVLMLLSLPVGTFCGIIILIGLYSRETREWFRIQR